MPQAMLDGATLGTCLTNLASRSPDCVARFPDTGAALTAAELDRASVGAAHAFLDAGIRPGDLVGVVVPAGPQVFTTLYGLWRIGAAVSVLPVAVGFGAAASAAQRLAALITDADIRKVVLDPSYAAIGEELLDILPSLSVVDADVSMPGAAWRLPAVFEDDLAVVQFTSGSTDTPKGVMLPHRNMIAGLLACVVSGDLSTEDKLVQWVPTYHDMGLISLMSFFLNGCDVHLFSPTAFLRRPAQLLQYFAEVRGTAFASPNFIYEFLLDAVKPDLLRTLDLSNWRLAYNGAEPISAATIQRFTETLAPCGVRDNVMFPVYGMAEATLSVAYPEPGSVPRTVTIDRSQLGRSSLVRVVPELHPSAKTVVAVGKAVHGIDIRLVDSLGLPCGPGEVGQIQISGLPVTTGYYRAPEINAFDGPWLSTGDLGFQLEGDLFVLGRTEEVIVTADRHFFPDDIESVVRDIPGVYQRRCVAFPDRAQVGVIIEAGDAHTEHVRAEAERLLLSELNLDQVSVHVVRPRWITRTTSGKWQRALASRRLAAAAV